MGTGRRVSGRGGGRRASGLGLGAWEAAGGPAGRRGEGSGGPSGLGSRAAASCARAGGRRARAGGGLPLGRRGCSRPGRLGGPPTGDGAPAPPGLRSRPSCAEVVSVANPRNFQLLRSRRASRSTDLARVKSSGNLGSEPLGFYPLNKAPLCLIDDLG